MIAPTLRVAAPDDREQVLVWNQAADVRARSLDPRPIAPAAHAHWFAARLGDPLTEMWIAEQGGAAVGVVRIERARPDDDGRISVVLDPAWRGRGLGRVVIAAACAAVGRPIIAEIHPLNQASQAAFAAAGFERFPSRDRDGVLVFRWSPP